MRSNHLHRLGLLGHEICRECNLSSEHVKCPAHALDRYALLPHDVPLPDEGIIENIRIAYDNGFKGFLTWHFYNEPLLAIGRIKKILKTVREFKKDARSLLWTNGTLMEEKKHEDYLIFDKIIISNYHKTRFQWLLKYHNNFKRIGNHGLDDRLILKPGNTRPCARIRKELVIDYYGNWRLCCADYVGGAVRMNSMTDGFQAIVDEYARLLPLAMANPQKEGLPDICDSCRVR